MMQIWRAQQFGRPTEVLEIEDVDLNELQPGMIEIKVEAAGVGLPDALMVAGNYPAVSKAPVSPGQEIAGTVTRTGDNCSVQIGAKLMSKTRYEQGFGGFAETCQVHESQTAKIPEGMSVEEAAGFWVPFHTGYTGLIHRGQLLSGETLLVLGGAGSSGSAAIQLGKAVGAEVIATVSSAEKALFCKKLGADHTINYTETPIHQAIKELKGRDGVNVIFDPVGGQAYQQAVKCIARNGRVILIGYSSGEWPVIDPLNAILRSYSLVGAFPGGRTTLESIEHHNILCEMAKKGKIRVPVDQIYEFKDVPKAIERIQLNQAVGKIIVRGF